jgi:DNA-binding HxlR family transcriptional regulator
VVNIKINDILKVIKYKNRDRILAFLRTHDPVYYEDLEVELERSKDYVCQLLCPLKRLGLILIKTIDSYNTHDPRKEISLTSLGRYIVDNVAKLWMTDRERKLLDLMHSFENDSNKYGQSDIVNKEEIDRIVLKSLEQFLTPHNLPQFIVESIGQRVSEKLLDRICGLRTFDIDENFKSAIEELV